MRAGFFLDNMSIPEVDLTRPQRGNPGIGGTEYRFAALPWAMNEFGEGRHEPILLAPHLERLPPTVASHHCPSVFDAPAICREHGIAALVFRPWSCARSMKRLADELVRCDVVGLAWAGNALDPATFKVFAKHPGLWAYVSVGREIIDYYRDLPIVYKSTYIYNGVRTRGVEVKTDYADDPPILMYMGSLIPAKGFARLARLWPRVREVHPSAQLHVIGSGQLYDRSLPLGPLGLADADFERQFLPPLLDASGDLDPSVTFHGIVGVQKYAMLRRASVGVANPTGETETFCAAAVEFQIVGVPVVSAAEGGLLDTVVHGETGLLCRTDAELVDAITTLLGDPQRRRAMGEKAAAFARERFTFERAVAGWLKLLDQIESGQRPRLLPPKSNLGHHRKWLKEGVRIGKRVVPPWRALPPIERKPARRVFRQLAGSLVRPGHWSTGWQAPPGRG